MTFTVQYTQFSFIDADDYGDENEARERYNEVCADPDTTVAYLFDGPGADAEMLEEYYRS